MKLILKDGMAFLVAQGYVPNKALKVNIDIEGLNITEFKMSVKVNNQPSRTCSESFTISVPELNKPMLNISVKITHKGTGNTATFKMDPIKLQQAILVGNNIEEQYPASYKLLMADNKAMKEKINLIAKAIVELGKRGEIL